MKIKMGIILILSLLLSFTIGGCFKESTAPTSNQAEQVSINITNPAPWSNIYGQVEIRVGATPINLVESMEFYIDGVLVAVDSVAPFTYNWDANIIGQSYTIYVRAVAKDGSSTNSSMITVFVRPETDIEPPAVWITYPAPWISIGDTVEILSEATDNINVAAVVMLIDGVLLDSIVTAPYYFQWDTTEDSVGYHTLLAKAYDSAGNIGYSDLVIVAVQQ
jgi:hypothetical protein